MRTRFKTTLIAAASLLALAACSDDTERTIERDLERAGDAVEREAKQALASAEDAAHEVKDATESGLLRVGESASDAWITAKVKTALLDRMQADALDIDVDTKDGVVTLRGELDDADALPVAASAAKSIKGVASVQALITHTADARGDGEYTAEVVSDAIRAQFDEAKLNARVRTALLDELGADAALIRLDAEGTSVIVGGAVSSAEEKRRALNAVRTTEGVAHTVDRLETKS